ncbi:MAG: hypothetical protein AAF849_06015 [Bacteroidota bacterium]
MSTKQIPTIYNQLFSLSGEWLDLSELSRGETAFAQAFIDDILQNKAVQEVIEADYEQAKKIQYLQNESYNLRKLEGRPVLGIGFPTLVAPQSTMPLFIWEVNLQKLMGRRDAWSLQHFEVNHLRPNPAAVDYLKTAYNFNLEPQLQKMAYEKSVTFEQITNFLKVLPIALPEQATLSPLHRNFPAAYGCMLLWSGVLGIFKASTTFSTASFAPSDAAVNNLKHDFGILKLNPDQEKAYQHCITHPQTVIDAVADTGKTYLLVQLLSNALFNGKSCLVLSRNAPKLQKAQRLLEQEGIGNLHFLLKDAQHDPYLLLELLRTLSKAKKRLISFDQNAFDILLDRTKAQKDKLRAYHQFVEKKCFQSLNWTATVGQFLHYSKIASYDYLDSYLKVEDFDWSEEELELLLLKLKASELLYQEEINVKHPLKKLHPNVFIQKEKEEARTYARTVLEQFIREANLLTQAFARQKSNYRSHLSNHYEQQFHQIQDHSDAIKIAIQDGRRLYQEDFDNLSNISIGSRRNKQILKEREQIFARFQQLKKELNSSSLFDFWLTENNKNLGVLENQMNRLDEALEAWKRTWNDQLKEEIRRLSSKTSLPELNFQPSLTKLESGLRSLFSAVNEAEILREKFEDKNLTLHTQHRQLEGLLEELQSLAFHLKDFDVYFDWQKHFLQCKDKERKLLIALQKARPPQWAAALQSWYLYHFLSQQYDSHLKPLAENEIQTYAQKRALLKPLLLQQMNQYWHERQADQSASFQKKHKKDFQRIFKKPKQKASLMEIQAAVNNGFDAITAFTPILFSTPEAADAVFAKSQHSFDYVIVQEAHLVPNASIAPLLRLGKQQIFIGDQSLSHALATPSVFEEAIASALPVQSIRQLYGSAQGLKAAVFDAQSSQVQPDTPELHIQNVEGRFEEEEQHNTVEAEAIIRLLNQFEPNKIGQYPRIGIATFTTAQRDLILAHLEGVKQERRDLMERFERSGLGVFRLDELYAQEFDILIFSTTFGAINQAGELSTSMNLLDLPQGIALVKSLIASTQKELFIIHSIPENTLATFRADTSKEGRFLLAQFFQYATAVQSGDPSLQQTTLTALSQQQETEAESAIFMDEVAAAIKPYLEKNRVFRNATVENHNMPLVVQPKQASEHLTAIYAEGILAEHLPTNYEWEHQMQQTFQQQDIDILSIWSIAWWKNQEQEIRKLAGRVIAGSKTSV